VGGPAARPSLVTIPNVLTAARLVLLPIIVAGIATEHGWVAVVAMGIGLVTDLLDGRIARRMRTTTAFGKSLDSTVDFVFIYSLFIALYAAGHLATYQFAVLYLAMLSILAVQVATMGAGGAESITGTRLGKPTGALQFLYLLFLVALLVAPPSPALNAVGTVFFGVLAVAIVLNTIECAALLRKLV